MYTNIRVQRATMWSVNPVMYLEKNETGQTVDSRKIARLPYRVELPCTMFVVTCRKWRIICERALEKKTKYKHKSLQVNTNKSSVKLSITYGRVGMENV